MLRYIFCIGLIVCAQQSASGETVSLSKSDLDYAKGINLLSNGDPTEALRHFEDAYHSSTKIENQHGVVEALNARSQALYMLGRVPEACETVVASLNLKHPQLCESDDIDRESVFTPLQASMASVRGLNLLGNYLLKLGHINSSKQAFHNAQRLAEDAVVGTSDQHRTQLGLANARKILVKRTNQQSQRLEAGEQKDQLENIAAAAANKAFSQYEALALQSPEIEVRATLNWLELFAVIKTWEGGNRFENSPIEQLYRAKLEQASTMLDRIDRLEFDALQPIDAVYSRLAAAEQTLQHKQKSGTIRPSFELTRKALTTAQALRNVRGQSFALGLLGRIYEANNQRSEAVVVYREASRMAHTIQAWDSAYQWQGQLGKLLNSEGKRADAIASYQQAIESLRHVREDVLSVDSEMQFSFQKDIAPVYRGYVNLLLSGTPSEEDLRLAVDAFSQLQTAELENYLRCGRLDTVEIDAISDVPPTIYVLDVEGGYHVVLRKPDGSIIRHRPNTDAVGESSTSARIYIDDIQAIREDELASIVPYGKILYREWIKPLESHLPKSGTLNFVLDTSLQHFPIAVLHDGNDHITRRYSLSVLLKDQLRAPKKLEKGDLKTVAAGVSDLSPSMQLASQSDALTPLPEVKAELEAVTALSRKSKRLHNDTFTINRLKSEMALGYPILHIASHGQFSSDPEQNVLYAWDETITGRELHSIISERSEYTDHPIELLVLSACETAVGDERSVLGIAGLSIEAGARSTLASLWFVDSRSTQLLMRQFYDGLQQGHTKAEALRQAQEYVRRQPGYSHPYFWAGFILSGSWL